MASSSDPTLPSLVVKRGRLGNIHLRLTTHNGNLKASLKDVGIVGRQQTDMDQSVRSKIAALAEDFLRMTEQKHKA